MHRVLTLTLSRFLFLGLFFSHHVVVLAGYPEDNNSRGSSSDDLDPEKANNDSHSPVRDPRNGDFVRAVRQCHNQGDHDGMDAFDCSNWVRQMSAAMQLKTWSLERELGEMRPPIGEMRIGEPATNRAIVPRIVELPDEVVELTPGVFAIPRWPEQRPQPTPFDNSV